MTGTFFHPSDPTGGPRAHLSPEALAAYGAQRLDGTGVWSVETHLARCPSCRGALSAQADRGRLVRNRSALLVRAAVASGGPLTSLLRRCRVPEHLLSLAGATPSLRRSWWLAVFGVLAVLTGESVLVARLWTGPPGHQWAVLVPFVLLAPLLVLAAVAASFLPRFDPAAALAAAAPFSGLTLVLLRTLAALGGVAGPVLVAALLLPGPAWLPAALLVPSLALCALALAAATATGPLAAAVAPGVLWMSAVLAAASSHPALVIVGWRAQAVCSAALVGAGAVVYLRRDRFEFGLAR